MKIILFQICFLLLICASATSQAAVLTSDWKELNDGLITIDTATGLEWLDLTESRSLAYAEVVAQMGAGGNFEGWRYATTDELDQLISNFGYQPMNTNCPYGITNCDTNTSNNSELIEHMIRTLGDTYDVWLQEINNSRQVAPDGAGWAWGLLIDTPLSTDTTFLGMGLIYDSELISVDEHYPLIHDQNDQVTVIHSAHSQSYNAYSAGSFLIRAATVPLPASAWLLFSALISLIGIKKFKKINLARA